MRLAFMYFLLLVCLLGFNINKALSQQSNYDNLPDLTGTWQGELSSGNLEAYSEIYLVKLKSNQYSGIIYFSFRNKGDRTPFGDPKLQYNNKLFLGHFDGKMFYYDELDTVMTSPVNKFYIFSDANLDFSNNNGTLELNKILQGFSFKSRRISTNIPLKYSSHEINTSTVKLDNVLYLGSNDSRVLNSESKTSDDATGYIGFTITNSIPVEFKNVQIDMYAYKKDGDGIERRDSKYIESLKIKVGKLSQKNGVIKIGNDFPIINDSVHFTIYVWSSGVQLANKEIKLPAKVFTQIQQERNAELASSGFSIEGVTSGDYENEPQDSIENNSMNFLNFKIQNKSIIDYKNLTVSLELEEADNGADKTVVDVPKVQILSQDIHACSIRIPVYLTLSHDLVHFNITVSNESVQLSKKTVALRIKGTNYQIQDNEDFTKKARLLMESSYTNANTSNVAERRIHLNLHLIGANKFYNFDGICALKLEGNNVVPTSMIYWVSSLVKPSQFNSGHINSKEHIKGFYDPVSKKLSLQAFGEKESDGILDYFVLDLTNDGKIKGSDSVIRTSGILKGIVYGTYMASSVLLPANLTNKSDSRFVGRWEISGFHSPDNSPETFSNQYIEFQNNGVGVSRNSDLNSIKNVKILDWEVRKDTLIISGIPYHYSLTNGILIIRLIPEKNISLPETEKNIVTLKKVSDNPFDKYKSSVELSNGAGSWIISAIVSDNVIKYFDDGYIYDPQNKLQDIYPISDKAGEINTYSYEGMTKFINDDSSGVSKYNLVKSINDNIKTDPSFYLSGFTTNSEKTLFNFRVCNGVMIINLEKNGKYFTDYLVKVGPAKWPTLAEFHNHYNYIEGSIILPPPGTHWETCGHCHGEGKVYGGTKQVFDHSYTNQNGYSTDVYRTETIMNTCDYCYGKGRFCIDDESGEKITLF